MYSSLAQTITVDLDVLLSVAVCVLFFRSSLRKNYPWMFSYLCLRAVTGVAVWFLLYGPLLASPMTYTKVFFIVHWASYMISAVLLFLACLDVYRQALAPLQGLVRVGTTIFRWAAVASVLVTATTLSSLSTGPDLTIKIGILLMRCVGTTELCLLTLLALSMRAISLSPRSRPFGMAIGLGWLAIIDCTESSVAALQIAMNPRVQILLELGAIVTLAVWTLYAALPEATSRKTVTVRADSTIYKWDQIAQALGHKGTQVALQPTQSFFLVDVEKVVERAFTRTLNSKESES